MSKNPNFPRVANLAKGENGAGFRSYGGGHTNANRDPLLNDTGAPPAPPSEIKGITKGPIQRGGVDISGHPHDD